MGTRYAAVLPEPVHVCQRHAERRDIVIGLTGLSDGNDVVASKDSGDGVRLHGGRLAVSAVLDVLEDDGMKTGISELSRRLSAEVTARGK